MQQREVNSLFIRTVGALMAVILLALGAYLQVPVIESLTHDSHHSQKEIYAFSAEIEECLEEDRTELYSAFHLSHDILIAFVQKCSLNGLCLRQTTLSRLERNHHSFLSPLNRKIYLLIGLLSSQLPQ